MSGLNLSVCDGNRHLLLRREWWAQAAGTTAHQFVLSSSLGLFLTSTSLVPNYSSTAGL